MMRRTIAYLLAAGLLASAVSAPGGASARPSSISTNARAAALIDVESGRILYSSRGNERMKIASLTKIMTAIVAIEHGKLSDAVRTSRRASGKEGSSIYLKVGEEMSLQNMLYGLMLRSGNDAATAIAEHVGGSEEGFVFLMNKKAEMLGLDHTRFMNPHGLDQPDHYSSANDLAKLTAYALRNGVFRDIVKTRVNGLMLRSGNDAATAIAEHVGGSEEGFVFLMNKKAEMLGLDHTRFMNPHGLDQPDHYSSANDLAKLTAYALRNGVFRDIVKTRVKTAPNPNDAWDYKWTNKNKMLAMYDGADGVKTGYTKQAFRCLVSSATRNGQQLAAVTLNDGDDWVDHRRLLDWGFANYPLDGLAESGQRLSGYEVTVARAFRYPLAAGERQAVRTRL
ncbi:D-alanyl-D-alanine carboxypeptidase family protein, partial [Paenibacillus darwinianus]|uniref:D-alanyl-D-alanine carboxypeptidase family protein n=1 Tax=Paenibacillus darwinianus TaxID=1380763 RepID=UPI00044D27BA